MAGISGFKTDRALWPGCALVAALAILAQTSFAQSKPRLAGNWNFNQDQSDDANQKIHDAQARATSQGGGYPGRGYPGGGYPGGGYPGGGGIGFPGSRGGMGGGMGRGGRGQGGGPQGGGVSNDDMEQLAANPKMLKIDQDDNKVTITDDSGDVTNLYPDGKKHKEKDSTGQSTTIKTHWDGDHLISESKLHSGKLTQSYELSSDGKQLYVVSTLDNSRLGPLVIRRVFDSASASTK
jgi:hypothetical protein